MPPLTDFMWLSSIVRRNDTRTLTRGLQNSRVRDFRGFGETAMGITLRYTSHRKLTLLQTPEDRQVNTDDLNSNRREAAVDVQLHPIHEARIV